MKVNKLSNDIVDLYNNHHNFIIVDAVQYTVQQLPTKKVIYPLLPDYNNNHYHTLSMSSGKVKM